MSGTAASSAFNARTYSRNSVAKRKQSDTTPVQKRRRISEREPSTDPGDDDEVPSPRPIQCGYSSPERRRHSPRLTKDLSAIFESVTPTSSPLSSPTKLAKRMLARSKTDSSIDSRSGLHINRTPSMPNLPSSSPPKASMSLSSNPLPPPVSAPTNTRTYAGISRSFLAAIPASNLDPVFPGAEEEDDYSTRESYESLRSRWGVDNSEDDPYPLNTTISPSHSNATTPKKSPSKNGKGKGRIHQDTLLRAIPLPVGMMNPLKSITELRSKGESRRFLDEVGYLFEGMDPNGGIGLRRASALEITTKLCDIDFARKAKAADFLRKTWDVFIEAGAGRGEDKVLDTVLALFCALVSRDPTSLTDLAQHLLDSTSESEIRPDRSTSLVDTLFSLLSSQDDPLALVAVASAKDRTINDTELKKMRMGKKEKALFLSIHDIIISRSSLFPPGTPISTSLLLVRSMQTLPPALIPKNHFPNLLTSLHRSVSSILPTAAVTSAHLTWHDAAPNIPFQSVYYHLRLLDVYLLRQWGSITINHIDEQDGWNKERRNLKKKNERALETAREEWLVGALIAVGVCAELRGGSIAWASTCMEIALRVLVSLTHADKVWALKALEYEPTLGFVLRVILSSDRGRDGKTWTKVEDGDVKAKGKETLKQELDDEDEEAVDRVDGAAHALDRLCLALGLLTNLVQAVESMKEALREIRLNPSCTLKKHACIRRCICPQSASITALDVLVRLYNRQQAPVSRSRRGPVIKEETSPWHNSSPGADTADVLFLRGHLAVLFGLLMRGSPDNKISILDGLRGAATYQVTLGNLADQAREFVAFYDVLSGGAGEESEQRVARDVVSFLEGLRDAASS